MNIKKQIVAATVVGVSMLSGCAKDHSQLRTTEADYEKMTRKHQTAYIKAHSCLREMSEKPYAVFFDNASSVIPKAQHKALDAAANCLKAHPKIAVCIEGFASQKGNDEFNAQLSEKRAKKVRKALIARGVSPENILYTSGLGVMVKHQPHHWELPAEAYNRRVNITPIDIY